MNRWIILAAVLLSSCTGCLYYAYPSVAHVTLPPIENADGGVHAFRVDIDRTERNPNPPLTQYTLSRLLIDQYGQIPSQLEVAPVTGVYNPLGLGETVAHERTQYTMTVRLYRPGSCTQEVKSWQKPPALIWVAAPNLAAQEKAVDDLLAPPSLPGQTATGTWWERKDEKSPGLGLEPGLVSGHHHEALEFASKEYQRLSESREASTPEMQQVRARLRDKSLWLQTFAKQPAAPPR